MMPIHRIPHINNLNFTKRCSVKIESTDSLKKRILFGAFFGALFMLNAASDDCKHKAKVLKVDVPCTTLYVTAGALFGGVIARTAKVSIPIIILLWMSNSSPAPRPRKI